MPIGVCVPLYTYTSLQVELTLYNIGEYHAVNQIVGKSLHTSDEDALSYTKRLIERLESMKVEHAGDESIVDNDVAKAYVEQFAQQTFDRAEKAMSADKATR